MMTLCVFIGLSIDFTLRVLSTIIINQDIMIKEFQAFFTVFKKGKMVANPEAWKTGQVTVNLVALLSALAVIAAGFGYDLQLSQETIQSAGSGMVALFAIVNSIITVVSTEKIGVDGKPTKGKKR